MGPRATYSPTDLRLELGSEQVVFIQALSRTSGSYAGMVTPNILAENLMKSKRLDAKLIVAGSYRNEATEELLIIAPS